MSKSVCALAHKPGTTPEAFQRYYEENHAPLAIGLFPFSAYVRNHIVDAPGFGWDTISEFWSDDMAHTALLMDGPVGDTMRADEERFMDRTRIAPGGAKEEVITQGPRDDGQGRRTCLLLNARATGADVGLAARSWATELARDRNGVCIDIVTPWSTPHFPAGALIWLPGWVEVMAGPANIEVRQLKARRCETPQAMLMRGRA